MCKTHEEVQISKFRCGEKFCLSSYDNINTFKKHLREKHKIPDVFKKGSKRPSTADANLTLPASLTMDLEETADPETFEKPDEIEAELEEFKANLFRSVETFIAKQYSKPSLPRSHVQNVMNDCMGLLSGPLSLFREKVKDFLSSHSVPAETTTKIEEMLDALSNPFVGLDSEYRRLKHFEQCSTYIPPVSIKIGERLENQSSRDGAVKAVYADAVAQFIPPSQVLKRFLEMSDVFPVLMSEMRSLKESDLFTNVIQSFLWLEKTSRYSNDDVVFSFFFFFYTDDFEPNRDSGPHSGKLGGIYGGLPILPPECRSRLENIFLLLLYDAYDRVEFGNTALFSELVKDLQLLEREGITINVSSEAVKVYFVPVLLLGDNLALHQLLGLNESFSSMFYCRFCKMPRDVLRKLTSDVNVALRNRENYESDLLANDRSQTGVASECCFNAVDSFHVTENYTVDFLHDIAEGVCDTIMLFVLKYFINVCKPPRFDIETLNFRMDLFKWGPLIKNKPALFSANFLSNEKLKMTGSEKLSFVKLFGVLAGDLVDTGDPYWELYLCLRKVIEITMVDVVTNETPAILQDHVKDLLEHYLSLSESNYLKPKAHFLTHHMIMHKSGPLKQLNCSRYEAKHKQLKASASATTSRRNLALTVATKHQLNFFFRLKCNLSVIPPTEFGPGEIIKIQEDVKYFLFRDTLPLSILQADGKCFCRSYVEYKGTKYTPSLMFADVDDFGLPGFAAIKMIVVNNDLIVFVCQKYVTLRFDEHVHAYKVAPSIEWKCYTPQDLVVPQPFFAHTLINQELRIVM